MQSDSLLRVDNLSFERGQWPLFSGVTLQLLEGDIVLVEGANGCGKTTLIRLLTTLLTPSTGTLAYRGRSLDEVRYDYLNDILYIGHQSGVKGSMSARENLTWMLSNDLGKGVLDGAPDQIENALVTLGLQSVMDIPCHHLSMGQIRRVALARLVCSSASLWFLDEPFAALDAEGIELIQNLMRQHRRRQGAILLTSHQDLAIRPLRTYNLEKRRG